MAFFTPYRQHNYMGEYATDAAALTFIQANEWDTAGDGTGNPQKGMLYYNTASDAMQLWTGAAWVALGTGSGGAPISSVLLGSTYTYTQGSTLIEEVTGNGSVNGGNIGTLTAYFRAAVTNSWQSTGIGETTRVRLYDMGPAGGPPDVSQRLVSELTFTAQGGPRVSEQALTVVSSSPTTNQILDSDRAYEVVIIQDASTVGDVGYLGSAGIELR